MVKGTQRVGHISASWNFSWVHWRRVFRLVPLRAAAPQKLGSDKLRERVVKLTRGLEVLRKRGLLHVPFYKCLLPYNVLPF